MNDIEYLNLVINVSLATFFVNGHVRNHPNFQGCLEYGELND
jgi:hypothetical protein